MAIAFVQDDAAPYASGSSTTIAKAFTSNVTAGNLIVVTVSCSNTGTPSASASDSLGNTYQLAVGPTINSGLGLRQWIFYAQNIAGGPNTVTVTFSPAASSRRLMILEYSGLATTSVLDQATGAIGTTGTPDSGSVTTTQAEELIFGAGGSSSGDPSAGAGFTGREQSDVYGLPEDKIVSSVGSYSATFGGSSGSWIAQIATFKAPAGGGGTAVPVFMHHFNMMAGN